jgi:hypothetical protein
MTSGGAQPTCIQLPQQPQPHPQRQLRQQRRLGARHVTLRSILEEVVQPQRQGLGQGPVASKVAGALQAGQGSGSET